MSWIGTFTGGRFYPMGPDPDRLSIVDIAHSLGNMCRYTGHCSPFWSVAAHSIEVSHRVERAVRKQFDDDRIVAEFAMTGLLHDAGEAYLVDIPRPIKPLFLNYKQWSDALDESVAERFGIIFPHPNVVKEIDTAMLTAEIRQFFLPGSFAWKRHGITEETALEGLIPLGPSMESRSVGEGGLAFLARFEEIQKRMR